jgi:hypothetical protein
MRKKSCIAAYVYARSLDSCIKCLLPRFRRLLLFSTNYHNLFRESKNSRMPSDGACLFRLFSKTKMPSMRPVWCLPSFPPRFSRNPKIVKKQQMVWGFLLRPMKLENQRQGFLQSTVPSIPKHKVAAVMSRALSARKLDGSKQCVSRTLGRV